VLRLKVVTRQEGVDGRGKAPEHIKPEYAERRAMLLAAFTEFLNEACPRVRWFAGRALFWVKMADGSLATTWTPKDLFHRDLGIAFAAPWHGGYAIEVPLACRQVLLSRIRFSSSVAQQVDISRVEKIVPLHEAIEADELALAWRAARPTGSEARQFVAYFAPFVDREARSAVVDKLAASGLPLVTSRALGAGLLTSGETQQGNTVPAPSGGIGLAVGDARAELIARARASMQGGHYPRLVAAVSDEATLERLVGSGTIVRWDPISPLAAVRPGEGPEPEPDADTPLDASFPIVGEVDGGITARRYLRDVAWHAADFIAPTALDHNHANCVAGVLREAERWNNKLSIPS
jgi:hypothetical protein